MLREEWHWGCQGEKGENSGEGTVWLKVVRWREVGLPLVGKPGPAVWLGRGDGGREESVQA